jgi:hypothetical protein
MPYGRRLIAHIGMPSFGLWVGDHFLTLNRGQDKLKQTIAFLGHNPKENALLRIYPKQLFSKKFVWEMLRRIPQKYVQNCSGMNKILPSIGG